MHASFFPSNLSLITLCRWTARWTAAVLVVMWLTFLVLESFKPDFYVPAILWLQAAAISAIFAGYAIGWRHELPGGIVVLAGTIAFFLIVLAMHHRLPGLGAAVFALPGLLYLEAWRLEHATGGAPPCNS